jgi:glutamine synthetase
VSHTTERTSVSPANLFGTHSFSNSVMQERLPTSIYKRLVEVQAGNAELSLEVAEVVASAMRDWAIEKGATHFTHWFHPLTGLAAEKHDSFIAPAGEGRVIMAFSGKELIKGEPDASSFPSGGLRATFEARGYTAWDATSPAFLKRSASGVTLCIPTAFISYYGHALDKKVPLLRSIDALNKAALTVLRALGDDKARRVITTVGPEQEYFLVKRELFLKRPDLVLSGRSVFGSVPAKGQELMDHYFGAIEEKVDGFMRELNTELWAMGVAAKTQHNEVAPNQFELAVVFGAANVAADGNQLVMETIMKVAARHGMAALLHEKPFDGMNGSGKHINWSIGTDTGDNLLEPEGDPAADTRFLVFFSAVIEAVDRYASLLRASAATAGNDRRLGGHEAPPSVISIFIGDRLESMLESLTGKGGANGQSVTGARHLDMAAGALPKLPLDLTDRNRTSPFAYTGNKFEFRMVGSSQSVATPSTILSAVVAEVLTEFGERLAKAKAAGKDVKAEALALVTDSYRAHKRVIFSGNGYSAEWAREAERRGLPRFRSAVEAIPEFAKPEAVAMFSRLGVFTKEEIESRTVIYLERYAKQINIEAAVMTDMVRRSIVPVVSTFAARLAAEAASIAAMGGTSTPQEKLGRKVSALLGQLAERLEALDGALATAQAIEEPLALAKAYRESVVPRMDELRESTDALERILDAKLWPFPTYQELLFAL